MRTAVLPTTIRLLIEFRSSFVGARRGELRDSPWETARILCANIPLKILPEYIANSYLINPINAVICVSQSYVTISVPTVACICSSKWQPLLPAHNVISLNAACQRWHCFNSFRFQDLDVLVSTAVQFKL
jgi:hypothetical protein